MITKTSAFLGILTAVILALCFFMVVYGQEANLSQPAIMLQVTATAQPGTMMGVTTPMPAYGLGVITNTVSCPMMSGSMMGGSMTGTSSMGTMSGMGSMGSMGTMSGMGSMSGSANMPGMAGTTGMTDMYGMQGMTGLQGSGVTVQLGAPAFSIYTLNPWLLIGWVVLFLLVFGMLVALVLSIIVLIRRSPKNN